MQQPRHVLAVKPCDICGDVGYDEAIVTCSECNFVREHVYCTRNNVTEIPEYWLCESCQPKNDTTSPCKVNQDSGLHVSKRPPTGKVKFLPEDEVIKLSSGKFRFKARSSSTLPTARKTSVGSKNVIPKVPFLLPKSNPRLSPMVLGKLPRISEVHKNSMNHQRASGSLSKGDILCADAECKRSNIEKSNLQCIPENFKHYHKFLPSSITAWRGGFQILQAAASGKFYDGFEAQTPCTVNSKAYKFLCKMPSVLQLESIPASNVLTDVFPNDCPSLQDIALYFFPSDNTERSRKSLNSIFKFMNAEKSMLRSFIDGVELLIFTSNQLNMDSKGTIAAVNAGYFLWGLFRQNEIDEAIERLRDMELLDMDVDMIGGKDVVGRIDHVRRDNKPRSLSQWSLEGRAENFSCKTAVKEEKHMGNGGSSVV